MNSFRFSRVHFWERCHVVVLTRRDCHGDAFLLLPPFVFPDSISRLRLWPLCLKSKPPVWVFFALRFTHGQLEETMRSILLHNWAIGSEHASIPTTTRTIITLVMLARIQGCVVSKEIYHRHSGTLNDVSASNQGLFMVNTNIVESNIACDTWKPSFLQWHVLRPDTVNCTKQTRNLPGDDWMDGLDGCIVASQFFVFQGFNVVYVKTCLVGRFDQTYPDTTAVSHAKNAPWLWNRQNVETILKWTFNQENVDQEGFVLQKYV